jgi:hypothetical protein
MGQNKRPIRKPDELRGAAAHVDYEIEMLVYSASCVGGWHSLSQNTREGYPNNMALESFLLHFRNLRAFLCPSLQPVSIDDVCASDFFDEPEERDLGTASRLSEDQERLNKMLAHLSYRRDKYITAGDYKWMVARMLVVVLEDLQAFFGQLSKERWDWFRSIPGIETYLVTARIVAGQ